MSPNADVVIIGGGITGASAAYQLARRGVRVILCEKRFLGAGSSGKSSAILRQHYSNEITARMAHWSLTVFQNFSAVVGGDAGYTRTGFIMLVDARHRAGLEENVKLQQAVGVRTGIISLDELRVLDPGIAVTDEMAVAYEPEGGYADPALTIAAFAAGARQAGAEIWQETRVTNILQEGERVTGVETTRGKIECASVVNCANAWAPQIGKMVNVELPVRAERHQVATFQAPPDAARPRLTAADFPHEMYYRPEGARLTLTGSLDPAHGQLCDPDNYNEAADFEFLADEASRLRERYPSMEQAMIRGGWSGLYGVTPDWHPIIDEVPAGSGFFVAAGFSGHGFKLGPAVGVMIADMVTRQKVPTDLLDRSLFRYARFAEDKPVVGKYEYSIAG